MHGGKLCVLSERGDPLCVLSNSDIPFFKTLCPPMHIIGQVRPWLYHIFRMTHRIATKVLVVGTSCCDEKEMEPG